jgi:hypothetical protein
MTNFWSRAMGTPVAPAAPSLPSTPGQQQWWNSGQQPAVQPGIPQGLAVGPQRQANTELEKFYAQGYNDKSMPEWMKSQPTDHCPECGGVNFALHGQGEGTYGKNLVSPNPNAGVYQYGHCFDCNFTLNGRRMSDSQIGNAHTHGALSVGGSIQATRQPHGAKNFFEIK